MIKSKNKHNMKSYFLPFLFDARRENKDTKKERTHLCSAATTAEKKL